MSFRTQFTILLIVLFVLVGGDVVYVALYNEINLFFEISLLLVTLIVIGILAYLVEQKVFGTFSNMRLIAERLLAGEVLQDEEIEKAIPEQKPSLQTLQRLSLEIQEALQFIRKIGERDFSMQLEYLNPQEGLGKSLTEMRRQLQEISEEEINRNWTITGITKFSDLLREKQNAEISDIGYFFIRDLVNHVGANQGAVYIINNEAKPRPVAECVAAYAYSRRKFIQKTFELQEGLVGRCIMDKEVIYIDDIPENYIQITSGLGEALPRSIILAPIRVNEEIYGVVEIASMKKFAKHEIDFVREVSEDLGSTVANAQINKKTRELSA
ncbi:MAG: GAF domain-containing protein, partial [Raineya sp.]|nr:GAF domain-containing protein [Raineya sp.]